MIAIFAKNWVNLFAKNALNQGVILVIPFLARIVLFRKNFIFRKGLENFKK